MSVQRPEVLVAIVNYCTPDLTIDCLRSLEPEIRQLPGSSVIVADNASPDDSGSRIARSIVENGWSAWARLLPLSRNGGFAFGNNSIIREVLDKPSSPEFIWLLNSDTVVHPGAAKKLVEFLRTMPTVGIAGSCLEDPDETQQCSAFRFHSIVGEFEGAASLAVLSRIFKASTVAPRPERISTQYDWVSGASMMIRSDLLRQVGLMDEAYFLYYEETDFCRRARQFGWTCAFVSESRVVHLVGKSSGVTDRTNTTRRRSAFWFESRRHYFEKNHGRLYAAGADAALILGTLVHRLKTTVTRQPSGLPDQFLSDLVRHSAFWPGSIQRGTVS